MILDQRERGVGREVMDTGSASPSTASYDT